MWPRLLTHTQRKADERMQRPCVVFPRSGRTLGASVLNYVRTGAMHDVTFFQKRLRAILGDITFQDAYDRSGGRMLCVAVCATREGERPRLLNYLTAPHLIVWSAVAASCAFPGLFAPQPLLAKSRCGSLVPWQARRRLATHHPSLPPSSCAQTPSRGQCASALTLRAPLPLPRLAPTAGGQDGRAPVARRVPRGGPTHEARALLLSAFVF